MTFLVTCTKLGLNWDRKMIPQKNEASSSPVLDAIRKMNYILVLILPAPGISEVVFK